MTVGYERIKFRRLDCGWRSITVIQLPTIATYALHFLPGASRTFAPKPVLGPSVATNVITLCALPWFANDADFRINPYQSIPRFCVIFCR